MTQLTKAIGTEGYQPSASQSTIPNHQRQSRYCCRRRLRQHRRSVVDLQTARTRTRLAKAKAQPNISAQRTTMTLTEVNTPAHRRHQACINDPAASFCRHGTAVVNPARRPATTQLTKTLATSATLILPGCSDMRNFSFCKELVPISTIALLFLDFTAFSILVRVVDIGACRHWAPDNTVIYQSLVSVNDRITLPLQ